MTALTDTLKAHLYDLCIVTPLQVSQKLKHSSGALMYLKREDLQPVHSFKLRGAHNRLSQLTSQEMKKGVIAASAGNHAQGVALSARQKGISALIVMPKTAPSIKVEAVKSYGADVELAGDNYSEAFDYCQKLIKETGRVFIHPFDDPAVIAGQGTVGKEIIEQLPNVTHIFVPVGGGGLIAGIAQYVKSLKPEVKIIGVEPEDSNAMQASLKAGRLVTLDHVGIFADGVAVKQVGELTYKICRKYVDEVVTVTTDEICAAIKDIFEETRSIVEPAGALSLAAAKNYKLPKTAHAVTICSGANMTFERLQFIAERTLLGSGKEALFAITLPEKPGALQTFCETIVNGHSITEFNYRLHKRDKAHIFVGISMADTKDKKRFIEKLKQHGYAFSDLSLDEVSKEHIRHMIGGPSSEAQNESIYSINFPERPGALNDFLKALGGRFNISLFHYRGQGGDVGRVLIGFENATPDSIYSLRSKAKCDIQLVSSSGISIFV